MSVGATRDLPFEEQAPRELFGIVPGRDTIDDDFEGFGWSRVGRLRLEGEGQAIALRDAVVVALHAASPEEDESAEGDLDLELRVGDEVLIVPLSTFLATWAPRLPKADTWVLALCNPGHEPLVRPTHVPDGVALWFGMGDVDAWEDPDGGFTLTATRWICI